MKTYFLYLMNKMGDFDPVTDWLSTPTSFVTWRKRGQDSPAGPVAAIATLGYREGWLFQGFGLAEVAPVFKVASNWLNAQLLPEKNSLGSYMPSNYHGLFGDLDEYQPILLEKLHDYNALIRNLTNFNFLVSVDAPVTTPEQAVDAAFGPLEFGEDGQILRWCSQSRGSTMNPAEFWKFVKPTLLGKYKEAQDQRLCIADHASRSLELKRSVNRPLPNPPPPPPPSSPPPTGR